MVQISKRPFNFYISENLHTRLKKVTKYNEESMSSAVRRAIMREVKLMESCINADGGFPMSEPPDDF